MTPTTTAGRRDVSISTRAAMLEGTLTVPENPRGLVVFAHGSGSSRFSPRNRFVAEILHTADLGTLLFDLLTPEEDEIDRQTRELRFNIPLLADRLTSAVDWTGNRNELAGLGVGLFGASTGAAAALIAAARRPGRVRTVVSRGGRPDLAGESLEHVRSPTLLVVGELDEPVIRMNQDARARMPAESDLEIIPGATHLFEEPGALSQVASLARDWFVDHLGERTSTSLSP